MTVKEWRFGGLCVKRRCADGNAPVVYVNGGNVPQAQGWTVVSIEGVDWNRDLTPWLSRAVFRGQPDFGGGADGHLRRLTEEIIPAVEADISPSLRAIAGVSLAGLFAVYAALETERFGAAASVSGSMWYPGFAEYVRQRERTPELAYFSVGDREKQSRSAAFRSIDDCTESVRSQLAQRGVRTVFEHNPGGHFDDPDGRMLRALQWLEEASDGKNGGKIE